ncbi:MAG: hypothetical protein MK554_15305, partial [Planctomycetes bacterium]|nr:hypothetical protein [Planctomycetota bacterium]
LPLEIAILQKRRSCFWLIASLTCIPSRKKEIHEIPNPVTKSCPLKSEAKPSIRTGKTPPVAETFWSLSLSQAICRKPQAVSLVGLNSEEYAIIGLRLITVNPSYQPERTPNPALSNPDDLSGQRR